MAGVPAISVLMPVYNAELYLNEAIDSILNQSFKDFEFIIINDGSSDKSESIIESYDDDRIKYLKNDENIKLIKTLNRGLDAARGKYLARMDSDDISEPNRLMNQFNFMEQNSDVGACGTWCKTIGNRTSEGRYPTDDFMIAYKLLYQCSILHPSVTLRMSVLRENDLNYDMQYLHAEDYNLWYEISKHAELANLPEFLIKYRVHDTNISALGRSTQIANSSQIQKAIFKDLGIDVSEKELSIFEDFNHQVNDLKKDEIDILGKLLTQLLAGNKTKGMLDSLKLQSLMEEKWGETLNANSQLGKTLLGSYMEFGSLRGNRWNISLLIRLAVKIVLRK